MQRALGLLVCFCALTTRPAHAHEVRPAFLELVELDRHHYALTFKRPMRGGAVLRLSPTFPADCDARPVESVGVEGAMVSRIRLHCARTLSGREVRIQGLSATPIDALVQVRLATGDEQSVLLRGGRDRFVVARAPGLGEVATSYLGLGVEHVWLGIDHLLFVFGLLLVIDGLRSLLLAITAFTFAHSLTLALASLGLVRVPQAPVEAVIALSIVFLAAEIVRGARGAAGLSSRRPWSVALVVGLLHGLGFAGALAEVGLPQSQIPVALLSFNLGVELGQLTFVVVVSVGGWLARRQLSEPPRWLLPGAGYALGTVASFWVVERTLSFL